MFQGTVLERESLPFLDALLSHHVPGQTDRDEREVQMRCGRNRVRRRVASRHPRDLQGHTHTQTTMMRMRMMLMLMLMMMLMMMMMMIMMMMMM